MARVEVISEENNRIAYMGSIVTYALNISSDLWTDFVWEDDNHTIVKDFLDTPTTRFLIVFMDSKEKLVASVEFLQVLPPRSICFLKYEDVAIPQEDFKQHFRYMTLSDTPLTLYQAIYEKVFIPILCNPENNCKWPKDVFEDIVFHVQDFRKEIYSCLGQAKHRALLPIPEHAKGISHLTVSDLNSSSVSRDNVRSVLVSIGEMVMDWNDIITEILERSPRESTRILDLIGPQTILDYWRERKENLRFIFTQMSDPIVKQMAIALERTESCYMDTFKKLLQGVTEALTEAEEVAAKLEILSEPFEMLDTYPFEEIQKILPKTLEILTSAWLSSKYFRSKPSQIRDLVCKTCNLLIIRGRNFLNGAEILKEDRAVSQGKVVHTRNVLDAFIDAYYECRETMPSPFEEVKVYPWEFPDSRVFSCMRCFHRRLEDIEKLFEAADTYNQIPTYELFSSHLMPLRHQLDHIYQEFFQMYEVFADYNPLDPENSDFINYLAVFKEKLGDLDHRFGAAIGQGCVKCPLVSEAFELMNVFVGPLTRPIIETEFKSYLPDLAQKARDEMYLAKKLFEEQSDFVKVNGYCNAYPKLPPVSGSIRWAVELEERVSKPVTCLQKVEERYLLGKDVLLVYQLHGELMERLEKFRIEIFSKWADKVKRIMEEKLDSPIIIEEGNIMKMNYDEEISKVMSEVQMLQNIPNVSVPDEANILFQRQRNIRCSYAYLSASLKWYNKLSEDLNDIEMALIEEKWNYMHSLMTEGKMWTWKKPGVQDLSSKIYHFVKELFNDIEQTKENIDQVRNMIEIWSSTPMYCRKSPQDPVDFRIYMTPAVREKYNSIKKTGEVMKEKMKENLKLFNCDPESSCWKDYVENLEMILEDGLKDACACSLKYLYDNTDRENHKLYPFIVIYMSLEEHDIRLDPPLLKSDSGNLMSCIQAAIDKIFNMGTQIKRLSNEESDYEKALRTVEGLAHLKMLVIHHFVSAYMDATKKADSFKMYENFWKNDVDGILKDYLVYGPAMFAPPEDEENEEEELETFNDDDELDDVDDLDDVEEKEVPLERWYEGKPPTEDEFRQQIVTLEEQYRKAEEIQNIVPVESWLVFDVSSFKESLLAVIRRWISAFKHTLIEQKSLGKLRKVVKEEAD